MPNLYRKSIFLFICHLPFSVFAQIDDSQNEIRGKIVNEKKQALSFVTVRLYYSKDSVLLKTSQTDLEGVFLFKKIPLGSYYLSVDATGYKKYQYEGIEMKDN
ncbi:hypothetical protein GS399_00860 [Pedobacter sp. HMF7647]|uniref:Carboxypeptidase regulatory-like domain-containing protein n=1 Tax=Hufsiella arboris TaxID=2695275 RepID=A0A7K1Y4K1_9SPHI|nr:carboxypeptidase-like regulatory domain-containing protein [Hufsiella arboris]MXV49506.1 hypothetical protein [Hufsiella arboris]